MLREALTLEKLDAMPADEAAAYFIARRAEGLTMSEENLLADWLAADAAHARVLDSLDRGWTIFDRAGNDEILAAMRAHAVQARPGVWRKWPSLVAAAAVLCFVLVGTLLFAPSFRQKSVGPGQSGEIVAWTRYATAHGQVRSIVLADGSTMTLDAESVALTHFVGRERSIRLLRGRGFFEVAKDPTRPFAVAAADRRVVALGTRFEVGLGTGSLQVTLLKGRVAVEPLAAGPQAVFLDPGQRFTERDGAVTIDTVGMGSEDQPGWRNGLLDLEDMPLADAVAEFNLHSHDHIVIRDPAVARIRVSGQFRAGDAARFADTITEMYPLRVVRRDGSIEIVSAR